MHMCLLIFLNIQTFENVDCHLPFVICVHEEDDCAYLTAI